MFEKISIMILVLSLSYASVMQSSIISACIFKSFCDIEVDYLNSDASSEDCEDPIPLQQSEEEPIQLIDILETEHFFHGKWLGLNRSLLIKRQTTFFYQNAYAFFHKESFSPPPEWC